MKPTLATIAAMLMLSGATFAGTPGTGGPYIDNGTTEDVFGPQTEFSEHGRFDRDALITGPRR